MKLADLAWEQRISAFGVGSVSWQQGRILEANETVWDWMGRDPIGAPWTALFVPGSVAYWEVAVEPQLQARGQAEDVAVELQAHDERRPALAYAQRDGETTHVLLVPSLVRTRFDAAMASAKKRAQEQEAEVQHLLELEQLRTEFINSIAHEMGTPMTPVMLQMTILKRVAERDGNQAVLKAAEKLNTNLEKLERFHKSLLAAARVQASAVGISLQTAPLDQLVVNVVEAWQKEHGPRQALQVDTEPVTACVDKAAMRSCIEHLLDNAIRFSDTNDAIRVHVLDENGPAIHVQDAGRGIAPERITQLGRPFSKAHDQNVFTQLGAGLGLYIVSGLMRAQNGSLKVRSAGLGQGTDASLHLPPGPCSAEPVVVSSGRRPGRPTRQTEA